jgi:hypothetical protein
VLGASVARVSFIASASKEQGGETEVVGGGDGSARDAVLDREQE